MMANHLKKIVAGYDCQPIYNNSPQLGMGHSLSLAIRSLPSSAKAAVIMLGDQPTLHMNDILRVLRGIQTNAVKGKYISENDHTNEIS